MRYTSCVSSRIALAWSWSPAPSLRPLGALVSADLICLPACASSLRCIPCAPMPMPGSCSALRPRVRCDVLCVAACVVSSSCGHCVVLCPLEWVGCVVCCWSSALCPLCVHFLFVVCVFVFIHCHCSLWLKRFYLRVYCSLWLLLLRRDEGFTIHNIIHKEYNSTIEYNTSAQ